MDHHAEVQYQCKSSSHHRAALRQDCKCSPDEWQHGKMVKHNSRSEAVMSSVPHSLQHFFLKRIMSDALEEHDEKVSIGGRNTTNLQFANT